MIENVKYEHIDIDSLKLEFINNCASGNLKKIKQLLMDKNFEDNIDINIKAYYNKTAIMYACENGYLNIIKYLCSSYKFRNNIKINHIDDLGNNELFYAASSGNLELVKYLLTSCDLKEKANINNKNIKGWNSLMIACDEGYFNIAQFLVVDMNMTIDNKTMSWLESKAKDNIVVNNTLKLIKSKNLHDKLDSIININIVESKRLKI